MSSLLKGDVPATNVSLDYVKRSAGEVDKISGRVFITTSGDAPAVSWVDDFCRITVIDQTPGLSKNEICEGISPLPNFTQYAPEKQH